MKTIAKIAGGLFLAVLAFDLGLGIYAFMVSPLSGTAQQSIYHVVASRNEVMESIKQAKPQLTGAESKLARIAREYASLAARGNAFVDLLQLGLVSGNLSDPEVKSQAQKINQEAEGILQRISPNGKQPTEIRVLQAGMFNIGEMFKPLAEFLKEGLASREKKIEQINAMLEKHRWPEWEKIRPDEIQTDLAR